MKKLFFSLPCWGDEYIKKFLNYTAATLLANNNLPLLNKNGYHIVFQIFTKQKFISTFESHQNINALKRYAQVSYYLLDDKNNFSNVELFSYAHEQSLQAAAKNKMPVLFLCADALYSNGSFSFAVSQYEQGFQVVLAPPFRVNDYEVMECISSKQSNNNRLELTNTDVNNYIVNYLHQDEDDLAFPTIYKACGWSGIPSWYKKADFYLKNSPYYNPVLVVADESMSLKGGTLDNAPFINELFNSQVKIFVCDSTKDIGILDLAPQGVRQLPIDVGLSTPFDLALKVVFGLVQPWQYQMLKTPVMIYDNNTEALACAINQSKNFLLSVDKHVTDIQSDPKKYFYEHTQFISVRYTQVLGIELDRIQKIVNKICSKFENKHIVLYGCGEFFKFIFTLFNFNGLSIKVSDRNEAQLEHLSDIFPVIKLNKLETADVIIPMSLEFEFKMKEYLQTELKITTPIYIAHWHELRENNDKK